MTRSLYDEIIVDSFAGGGGASTGIEMALGRSPDIAINHDPEAVSMHMVNHPDTEHHCQNVWQVDPREAVKGRKVGLAWFSPDCKHFSKAKGGAPVKRNIRDLAWVVVLWAQRVKPRVIMLENVEEFQTWGPLTDEGKPCLIQKGVTFKKWVGELRKAGYKVEWRELRACDYGAPTIRKRLFLIARCDGQPIVWPEPTHGDPRKPGFEKSGLKPWRTAADIIDWSLPCPSIFMDKLEVQAWYEATGQRLKRPLAEATQKRIAKGLERFVFGASEPFIVTANHGGDTFRGQGLGEPFNTVTAPRDAHGLVVPYVTEHANASNQRNMPTDEPLRTQCANVKGGHFAVVAPHITKFRKGASGSDIAAPMPTITASSHEKRPGGNPPLAVIAPTLVQTGYGEREGQAPRALDIQAPLGTVVASGQKHALTAAFMAKHFGGVVGVSVDTPTPTTLTSGSQNQLVVAHIDRQFGMSAGNSAAEPLGTTTADGQGKSAIVSAHMARHFGKSVGHELDEPLGALTSKDKDAIVASHMVKLYGTCQHGQPTDQPAPTVTAGGYHIGEVRAFLTKYHGNGGQWADPRDPMHAVTSKDEFGLVTVQGVEYMLTDIGMRMLTPPELYRAQGFPESYITDRTADGKPLTKTAQVRMCGNSVCPPLAAALVAANVQIAEAREAAE